MIKSRNIAQALVKMLSSKDDAKSYEKISNDFVEFVTRYKLSAQVPQILLEIKRLAEIDLKNNTLEIYSPFELSKLSENTIKEIVGVKKDVKTKISIDKKLIGGFLSFYKDKKVDGSVSGKLERLEKILLT